MTEDPRWGELGKFLRARRAGLSPSMVGLPESTNARRVPGLRREEVADLAAISADYYRRLEQGRLAASQSVLAALAQALHLNDDERAYLHDLAGNPPPRPRRRATQKVRPQLQWLLDQLTQNPAFVVGRFMDVLAWNATAAALYTDFSQIPPARRNLVLLAFLDPSIRAMFADWDSVVNTCVGFLRMDAAQYPHDPRLAELVGELSVNDLDFRKWWAAHDVARRTSGLKNLSHPVVGDLTLDWETFTCATDPNQQLVIMTPEPGSPSQERLQALITHVSR
ncbi:helix-turn-helix transcriptional regulator [Mycobacteroides chelonae]|uniref:helix-turn-helix transcriptional regulator n=1 Tax=Mycobacteroides chelonae TaxID=1774 RepID=UPI0007DABAF3|nr:helix-turn-helix transcriptional regulator [Mycobacteroides chelonae]OLT80774.1 transcriptional regulator [Mycobacteroides chelonae]ORV16798.1 XRE family transcriptional regulator [Mycobacteroides chelonae]